MTSRDAVNMVQGRVNRQWSDVHRKLKVGHGGTLDPLAEGVLVIAIGSATRLISKVQNQTKHYRAEFRLGVHSPTGDLEGELQRREPQRPVMARQLHEAASSMVGEIEQRPPDYSAIKINGRRAYDLARAGREFEVPSRKVKIHRCDLFDFAGDRFVLDIECGSGTYVRTLGIDIADRVGNVCVMTHLRREAVGCFKLDQAISMEDIRNGVSLNLLPIDLASPDMPMVSLDADLARDVVHGKVLKGLVETADEVWASYRDMPFAILERRGDGYAPKVVLRT